MEGMFRNCSSLVSIDMGDFDTPNVQWLRDMFEGCSSLASIDLSSFHTEKVYGMEDMFKGCTSLTSLDLSSFSTPEVRYLSGMFNGCTNLVTITVGDGWEVDHVNSESYYSRDMFNNCTSLVGCMGTKYNSRYEDKTYAHIDGGPSNPGYLSAVVTPGDLDGSGNVDISDVTALIDYILSGDSAGLNLANADVDGDGNVNIGDLTLLIDYILSGEL